jgi:hypothetical protein
MSTTQDPGHPAHRQTIKEMPSETGMDDFDEHELTSPDLAPAPAPPIGIRPEADEALESAPTGHFQAPGVEIAVVHERGVAARPGQWRAFEIWTAKRVYAIDGQMLCFGVMDRASGRADERHAFLGARLMGGEHKAQGAMSFSHPLPTPGAEAVFQIKSATRGRYGHTSPVEKVVVRIRVTHAPVDNGDTLWEEITHTFRPPPGL